MRRILTSLVVAVFVVGMGSAHATGGLLGLSGGVNYWFHGSSGDVFGIDEDELDLDRDEDVHVWVEWDHILPMIPSVRFEHSDLAQEGAAGALVDLSHMDLTLFWSPLPLPYVTLDLGFTGRYFEGEIEHDNPSGLAGYTGDWESGSFSGFVPMLFARAVLDIPMTRFQVAASGKGLSIGDHSITDVQLNVAYKWWYAGAMAGYRMLSIELDELDDVTTDISFSGPYVGAFLRF
ncbi:hypothetical protein CKO15_07575 [Halorhodospira abdelmalekii]|uniref:TIGR04219 family outer membrane beta-barrel protein n=1 Tax=Halorhodospira abdelmalekii TaxID=421629 RepID=UPI0019071267|nr:TIGR04219 family outer membrane beta-barrel protein [Halorhodospira abdelmalekii]MBK1735144.1 hypothetical protein [Halorhodospira abdelmalekii]